MVITAAAPVLGSLVNPADPYLLHSPFPWLLLAPLAVALQHGLWAGLTSSVLLSGLAAWYALSAGTIPESFTSWSIGCGLTALIAGQIRDSVRGRTDKLTKRADHLQDRLERSERSRHLIQLSHAKLEERVVSSRTSLASAMDDAGRRMNEGHSMQELAQVLMDVLATQGHLHAATLYVAARDHGILLSEPVASFGGTGTSSALHPLVVRAFSTNKLAAIVDQIEVARNDTSVLAAVPLITARRRTVGVVAIHQMPFMMFHEEQLNQVFVLAGHLADLLFDRWSEVHGETQLARERDVRPSVMLAAVSSPVTAQNNRTFGAELGALAESNTKESAVASDESLSISIEVEADEVPAVETVNVAAVGQVRATRVDEAKRAADKVTTKLVRDRVTVSAVYSMRTDEVVVVSGTRVRESVEISGAHSEGHSLNVSVAARELESVLTSNVVGVFERGSAVAKETPVEETRTETVTSEPTQPLVAADEERRSEKPARTTAPARGRKNKRRAKADTSKTERLLAQSRKTAAATVEAIVTSDVAPAMVASAETIPAVPAPAAHVAEKVEPVATTSVRSPVILARTAVTAPRTNKGRVNTDTSDHTRDAEITPSEPEARESRTILPPPVENARTAILAAFARKARSEESDSTTSARPIMAASFRSSRISNSIRANTTSVPAAPTRTASTPVPEAVRATPAKAEDARASVRAAFQKARMPAPVADTTTTAAQSDADVARTVAAESTAPLAGPTEDARANSEIVRSLPRPVFDDSNRPSIEEARANMLATFAKARSISPTGRPSQPAMEAATASVTEAASSNVERVTSEPTTREDDSGVVQTHSVVAPVAPAKAPASERAARLPAPPAPAGFAAVRNVVQPAGEPRSRTQSLNGVAPRSSSSL
jgi:hypothetical protein